MACPGLGSISGALINGAATALGVPCEVVRAQLNEESGGQLGLTSSAGAQGPWQFLPSTYTGTGCAPGGINNPVESTACYVKYMGQLLKQEGGNVRNALAAYNAGPGNISAGLGYADTILSAAGKGSGLTASGGTGKAPGGGGAGSGGGGGFGAGGGGSVAGYETDIQPIIPEAQTASFFGDVFTTILDPFKEILGAERDIASFLADPLIGITETFKAFTTFFGALTGGLKTIIHDVLWLFNPSHWVRIVCFLFGLLIAIPAAYALMHTGSGTGDVYLAMGIALTTLSGILLFLAFHNLPYDPTPGAKASSSNVISLQSLLAYISEGVRSGVAPGGINVDALYSLEGQGADTGGGGRGITLTSLLGSFSPDSTSPPPRTPGFVPATDATSLFPTITPSGIFGGGLPITAYPRQPM